MNDFWGMAIMAAILLVPVILIFLDIFWAVQKKEKPIFELLAFGIGGIYMLLAYIIWDLPDYTSPLNVYGTADMHEPFNGMYGPALLLFALWGFFSYYILKFFRKRLSPLVTVFLLAGIYVGWGLSVAWIVQLLCGARVQLSAEFPMWNPKIWKNTVNVLEIICLCIVPLLYLIHTFRLMAKLIKEKAEKQKDAIYKNNILQKINTWLLKGANLFGAAAVMLVPVLGLLVLLLCLFGQQPDSIILAFTQTSDWILSKEIAPPPVAYDTHYLCTVSLRGHKKVVKPLRYGMRRGEKIVVNRQLCIANAFEELISEKTPKLHRAIRNFYDTYGYPLSKHIQTAFAADITYLLMKPLEWLFLLILYLIDEKPENRIAGQYLPEKDKCGMQQPESIAKKQII